MSIKKKSEKLRIIIADDHPIFRAGLIGLIDADTSIEVVAQVSSGKDLLKTLETQDCDLIMLDISMPELDGVAATKEIRKKFPKIKIIIITMHDQPMYIRELFSLGINGYILKTDVQNNILRAIDDVRNQRRFVSGDAANALFDKHSQSDDEQKLSERLTNKEIEVVKFIAQGMTSRQVAQEMNISQRTVETHRYNVYEKLGINNTAELIKFAIYNNIV